MSEKTIKFKPNAVRIHAMALEEFKKNKLTNAIRHMRMAIDASPQNGSYWFELAQLYSNAGLYDESCHIIMRLMIEGIEREEFTYLLAANLYYMKFHWEACRLFRNLLYSNPDSEYAPGVDSFLSLADEVENLNDRGGASMARMRGECERMILRGEYARAESLLRKCAQIMPADSASRALRGILSALIGAEFDEMRELRASLPQYSAPASLAGLAMAMLGDEAALGEIMRYKIPDGADLPTFNLHVAAVIAYNMGRDAQKAGEYWERIAVAHKHDLVAAHFRIRAMNGELPERPMKFDYELSFQDEAEVRVLLRTVALSEENAIVLAWRRIELFRNAVMWCARYDRDLFLPVSEILMRTLEKRERLELYSDFCLATGEYDPSTFECLLDSAISRDAEFAICRAVYAPRPALSAHESQVVNFVCDSMELKYKCCSRELAEYLLKRQVERPGRNSAGLAAELTFLYLIITGREAPEESVAKLADVPERMARHRIIKAGRMRHESD